MSVVMDTKRLIRENANAPADTLIRVIYDHFAHVRDDDAAPGEVLATVDEALERWYDVDELTLVFDKPDTAPNAGSCDYFVKLIHQDTFARPLVEDISDYSASLEDVEAFREAVDPKRYALIYGGE